MTKIEMTKIHLQIAIVWKLTLYLVRSHFFSDIQTLAHVAINELYNVFSLDVF